MLNIEMVDPDRLIPYLRNARTHSQEQVEQIAASIREFGFTNPILIGDDDGIVAGHGRLMAAKLLGLKEVPVIVLAHLNEVQRRALVLADNRIAESAGWDEQKVAEELAALRELDFDLDVIGFSEDEVADLFNGLEDGTLSVDGSSVLARPAPSGGAEQGPADRQPVAGLTDADEAPEPQEDPVTQDGDVWILGEHRLRCGDATDAVAMVAFLAGEQVDMWLTDPHYNVAYEGGTADALTIQNDDMKDDEFRAFLTGAYRAADAVMKPGGVFYIWHADSEGFNFRGACRDVGWRVRQCLVWKKSSFVMGRQDYHWKHEPCLYGWNDGAAHLWASDRTQSTILEFDKPSRNGEHPTMKPVALFAYQLLNNTNEGGIVLDSFGGSGTTLIAAQMHKRRAFLLELDPRYCDVIVKRWQEFTGQAATLQADGATFARCAERAGE